MKFLWPSQNIPTLRKSQYVLLFDIQITQETQHTKSLSIIFLYFWITLFAITDRMLYKLHRKKGCNLAALAVGCFANCIINYCVQLKDHLCPAALNLLCQKIMVRKMNFYPEFNCKLAEL